MYNLWYPPQRLKEFPADIYYQGKNLAYGYMFFGGLAQYAVVGKEILEGDEGCYLIPVDQEAGYAETALTEPWACVEAAYSVQHRTGVKEGGLVRIAGAGEGDHRLDGPFHPRKVIASHLPSGLREALQELSETEGFELVELVLRPLRLQVEGGEGQDCSTEGFDDIIVLGPEDSTIVEAAQDRLAKGGILNIIPPFPPNVGGHEGGGEAKGGR